MKPEMRMTLGLGTGYILGRSRKLRWAWLLAAAGATGGLGGVGQLIRRQAGSVAGASAISKVAGDAPGRLVEAGKTAAVAAATGKMDSLVNRLHDQTEALRRPNVPGGGSEDESGDADRARRRSTSERPSDEDLYEEPEDEQDEDEPAARRRTAPEDRRGRPAAQSADEEDFDDEENVDDDDEVDSESTGAEVRTDRGGDRRASERGSRGPETRGADDERRPDRHGPRARSSSERSERGESPIRRTRR